MHTKLTIPERLKDLRVSEKRMSLQELSDATGIPSSTLDNYEKDENIDMSLGNLIQNGKKPTERKPLQKPKPCTKRYNDIKKKLTGRMPVNLTEAEIKGRDDRPFR